jgi:hypothetical protein
MKRIAYTLFFALYALATQATEDRVELPGQMIGRWSECLDVKFIESKIGFQKNDNQEVFAFEPVTLPDSECSGGTFYKHASGQASPAEGQPCRTAGARFTAARARGRARRRA